MVLTHIAKQYLMYKHISLWAVLQRLMPFSVGHPGISSRCSCEGLGHYTQILKADSLFLLDERLFLRINLWDYPV